MSCAEAVDHDHLATPSLRRPPLRQLPRHAIPGDAWCKIINYSRRDASFCHLIVPHFQNDSLVPLVLAENGEKFIARQQRPNEQDPHEKVTARPASRTFALQIERRRVRGIHIEERNVRD